MKNKQYAFTDQASLNHANKVKEGWIPVKNGQTIKKTVEERVKEQDNSSTISEFVIGSLFHKPL